MQSKIIQDISHYQQYIDFALMKELGQNYMIAKCMSGNGKISSMWESHYENGTNAGINIAPYLWVDPIYNPFYQAKSFLKTIENKILPFIVIDVEQNWRSWDDWAKNIKPLPSFSPLFLFNHFKDVYETLINNTDLPIIVYTANWFINAYFPSQAYSYLENIYTWWADYSLFNTTKVVKKWDELENLVPNTNIIPSLPKFYNTNKVVMWQFSGDKFQANGLYSNKSKTRLSDLDLNKWVNENITIKQFSKNTVSKFLFAEKKIVIETFKKSTNYINVLNVPYVSQLGDNATKHNNDCGAACGCMLLGGYKDIIPTVDEFYDYAQINGDIYLSASQIINVLNKYGVGSTWHISNIKDLMENLSFGKPIICLILYKTLVDAKIITQNTFNGYHFVLVVGYDTKNIYINDPLFGGENLGVPIEIFNQCWKDAGIKYMENPAYGCIIPNLSIGKAETKYDIYIVTSEIGLNVRKEPFVKNNPSNIIKTMKYKEEFHVISVSNGWGKLESGGYANISYAKKI